MKKEDYQYHYYLEDALDGKECACFVSQDKDLEHARVYGSTGNDCIYGFNIEFLYGKDGDDTLVGSKKQYGGNGEDLCDDRAPKTKKCEFYTE